MKEKSYTSFPTPQPESKVEQALASGEYFLMQKEYHKHREEAEKLQ